METVLERKNEFMKLAVKQAQEGMAAGGVPIGAVLVDSLTGKVYGAGHNQRVQLGSATRHGEIDALEKAGRQPAAVYARTVMFTTLSPCSMCSGAVLLYKIPVVVLGENETFKGEEELLESRGVRVVRMDDPECKEMMRRFIEEHSDIWNEDIGV
mmetsp:Transcript_8847/g.36649  ORF Transcript_8847/g.36649 Transcript_8847/m.36649 type:complete len:155 (+) Transcript_8847:23-487(+)